MYLGIKSAMRNHTNLFLSAGIRLVLVASLIQISFGAAFGQQDAPTKLSLPGAVSAALTGNANLKQAEKDYTTSLARLRIANFTTSYGAGVIGGYQRDPDQSTTSTRVFGSYDLDSLSGMQISLDLTPVGLGNERGAVGVTLRKPLMQGSGRLSNKSNLVLGATTDVAVENSQLFLSRQSTVIEVANAYYQAVLQQKRVIIQQQSLDVATQAEFAARKKVEAGLLPGLEASRAKLDLVSTEDGLNEQKRAAQAALDRLMVAIGTGVGQTPLLEDTEPTVELDTPMLDKAIAAMVPPTLEDAIRTALANRAELKIGEENILDQQRRVAITKDRLRPNMDMVMGYNSSDDNIGVLSSSLFNRGSLTTGVEYRVPLDKRRDREERDIASRDLDVLQKLQVYRTEQIHQEVRNAHQAVESDKTSLKINMDNLNEARENLKLAQRMVDEGLRDNREILDAKNALTRLQSSLIAAKINLYLDSLRLRREMGEDLTKVISK